MFDQFCADFMHILPWIHIIINLWPLLLTWFNFNPSKDNNHTHYNVWDEITYPFLNFNGATIEVHELINNFIPHFLMDAITYPCWD